MQPSEIPSQDTPPTLPLPTPPSPMPQLGSISSAGQSTMTRPEPMRPIGEIVQSIAAMAAERPATPVTLPRAQLMKAKESSLPAVPAAKLLRNDPDGQDSLTTMLYQTYASQATYGDKAQMMEYRDRMFQLVLADYPIEVITMAFIQHLKLSSTLPTPHCIAKLIDPSLEPLSAAMFVRIREKIKNQQFVSDAEHEYLRRFEAQELRKVKQTA